MLNLEVATMGIYIFLYFSMYFHIFQYFLYFHHIARFLYISLFNMYLSIYIGPWPLPAFPGKWPKGQGSGLLHWGPALSFRVFDEKIIISKQIIGFLLF